MPAGQIFRNNRDHTRDKPDVTVWKDNGWGLRSCWLDVVKNKKWEVGGRNRVEWEARVGEGMVKEG